jgi:hypothetical protein
MTCDILADVYMGTEHDWKHYHEITARFRSCHKPSLLLVGLRDSSRKRDYGKDGSITATGGDITKAFRFERVISTADFAANDAPEYLPEDIDRAFKEGTRCLAIGCHNAAAAMFRLCLDLATKSRLPAEGAEGGPNNHQRRNLAPRLEWLFEQKRLPEDLQELSTAVKDYGNDGAHDGNLDDGEADDLYDFAYAVLDRLYTQPERVLQMRARRDGRKKPAQEAE